MDIKFPVKQMMYTMCANGHSLCLECIFKIVQKIDEEVVVAIPCPLCRESTESIAPYDNKIARVLQSLKENHGAKIDMFREAPPDSDGFLFVELLQIGLFVEKIMDVSYFVRLMKTKRDLYRRYVQLIKDIKTKKLALDEHWQKYLSLKDKINGLKLTLKDVTNQMQQAENR